jgi:hypothetical protein
MIKNILGLAWVSLVVAACGSNVELGGPPTGAAGSGGTDSSGKPVPDDSNPESAPDTSTGGQPVLYPTDPQDYADGKTPCETDDDCCVVRDACGTTAYVVGVGDNDRVAELLAAQDASACLACIGPGVQVSCQNNVCVGSAVAIDYTAADIDERPLEDHCGHIDGVESSTDYGSVFGCGLP